MTTGLPAHLDHPAVHVKCAVCEMMRQLVDQCEEIKCCFAYQRRGHEGRVRDDARLAEDRAGERGTDKSVYLHAHAPEGRDAT